MPAELDISESSFISTVKSFVETNLDPDTARKVAMAAPVTNREIRNWERALGRKGWFNYTWPAADGGPGWPVERQVLFEQVLLEMNCPPTAPFGVKMAGPVIMKFGTAEQRARFIPQIVSGDTWWCQGYSEPSAGSDLALLSTRALRDGDHYVVSGQKIWTSNAHDADWMFALVRTSNESKKQDGISFLLIDMKTPGIEVRPIISLEGSHTFNSVFFDDVRVPVDNCIGGEGKGWSCAKYLLSHERLAVVQLPFIKGALAKLQALACHSHAGEPPLVEDPLFQAKLVDVEVRTIALDELVSDALASVQRGEVLGSEVSALKILGSELSQRILELSTECLGYSALPLPLTWRPEASLPSHDWGMHAFVPGVSRAHLYRRTRSILGGTDEIQKNILAKHLFGT